MRVLPRENEEINSEWIHDKARFSYDGLKRQRLDRPYAMLMGEDGGASLAPVTWKQGFEAVAGLLDRSVWSLRWRHRGALLNDGTPRHCAFCAASARKQKRGGCVHAVSQSPETAVVQLVLPNLGSHK